MIEKLCRIYDTKHFFNHMFVCLLCYSNLNVWMTVFIIYFSFTIIKPPSELINYCHPCKLFVIYLNNAGYLSSYYIWIDQILLPTYEYLMKTVSNISKPDWLFVACILNIDIGWAFVNRFNSNTFQNNSELQIYYSDVIHEFYTEYNQEIELSFSFGIDWFLTKRFSFASNFPKYFF